MKLTKYSAVGLSILAITAGSLFSSSGDARPEDKSVALKANEKKGSHIMVNVGLLVRLEAKEGKEKEVENFLKGGLTIVEGEAGTITWYAVRIGKSTFGIFDTFYDDKGRQEHLAGKVAAALMEQAPHLLKNPPVIEEIEILAVKRADR